MARFLPLEQKYEQAIISLVEGVLNQKLNTVELQKKLKKQEDFKLQFKWSH
jgi:C4-type Zn-finger protein